MTTHQVAGQTSDEELPSFQLLVPAVMKNSHGVANQTSIRREKLSTNFRWTTQVIRDEELSRAFLNVNNVLGPLSTKSRDEELSKACDEELSGEIFKNRGNPRHCWLPAIFATAPL